MTTDWNSVTQLLARDRIQLCRGSGHPASCFSLCDFDEFLIHHSLGHTIHIHSAPLPIKPNLRLTMTEFKQQLLQLLASFEGVAVEPSPVAGGTALFYRGKEFAHFHHDNELDLRLTKKVILSLGLSHPVGSIHHPTRAAGSPWIEVRFNSEREVQRAAELIELAVAQL